MGANVLSRGDMRGFYQILALKIAVTRSSFLHIGYNLQNFQTPNYLMLGLGFRFHINILRYVINKKKYTNFASLT